MDKDKAFPQGVANLFLDDLRQSGSTNMFGASEHLAAAFGLNSDEAQALLVAWMRSFPRQQGATS